VTQETDLADPPPDLDPDTAVEPHGTTTPAPHRRPRWVKVFGIIVGVVVLLFVILMLTGGPGRHGPGRHGGGGDTPPASVREGGSHTPPPGMVHGGQQP
jgi:hypothetical protein